MKVGIRAGVCYDPPAEWGGAENGRRACPPMSLLSPCAQAARLFSLANWTLSNLSVKRPARPEGMGDEIGRRGGRVEALRRRGVERLPVQILVGVVELG
jgi:hypothetical protein